MADWGLLGGLGEGLQQVGMAQFKGQLEEKLAAAREKRAEELEARREQRRADRERITPDANATQFVQKNGVWYEQVRSKQGNVLEERLAPENKVREFAQQEEDRRRSLENEVLTGDVKRAQLDMARKELANYDSDRAFDRQYKMASLEARARSGSYSNDNEEPSEEDIVNLLVDENKSTFDQIMSRNKDTTTPSNATDLQEMARRAVRDAYARGINPNAHLQQILKIYENKLRAGKPAASTSGSGAFSLDGS